MSVSAQVFPGGVVTADRPATLITLDVVGRHAPAVGPGSRCVVVGSEHCVPLSVSCCRYRTLLV